MRLGSTGLIGAVAIAAVLVVAIVSTAGHKGSGAQGPPVGQSLPPFAAPLALSTLTGDVNVSPTACSIRLAGSLTSCAASASGPVAVGFVTAGDSQCARLTKSLSFLAATRIGSQGRPAAVLVGIRGSRKQLAKLAVANPGVKTVWDRSGVLANRYGIAVCPTVVIAARGGRVAGTVIGDDANQPAFLVSRAALLLRSGSPSFLRGKSASPQPSHSGG